ncbi:hypothetical protein PR048_018124 [Dryococelus australis]|uniref:PiggyBac transposable element-derived protein domain-containing protein n=1 Tax=Dryococelus australis TaxID=614101 RepID=A0ABQ9HBE3_9NEOP|nr:hypothetical protein PR048_018124 [Dryococelus australis]
MDENADPTLETEFKLHELLPILEDNEDSSDHEEVSVAIMPLTNSNSVSNEQTPLQIFEQFIDAEVIDILVDQANHYAARKNKFGNASTLLLRGYVSVSRMRMFWEGSKDCYNELVASSLSQDRF